MTASGKAGTIVAGAAALLVAGAVFYSILCAVEPTVPFEDAAMLMRFAQHVADGHGMVWNVGDRPVDGATDFLFTILVAVTMKLGFTVEASTRALIVASHLILAGIILATGRRLRNVPWLLTCGLTSYLLLGPGNRFVQSYFGAPVFALAAVMLLLAVWWLIESAAPNALQSSAVTASALVLGLMRPEGNLLAGMMLLAGWVCARDPVSRRLVLRAGVFYGGLGALFLGWRFWYFGQLMPNPFYLKGGWSLYPASLETSLRNALAFSLPLMPILAVMAWLRHRTGARLQVARELIPALCFIVIWVLLSDDNNHWGRFQYAALPILLFGILRWSSRLATTAPLDAAWSPRKALAIAGIYACLVLPPYALWHYRNPSWIPDGRYQVASNLRPYAGEGLRMAVTEAGLLPLYSQWRAMDLWGLNDQWIARHGLVTDEYLSAFKPDLIMLHDNTWPNGNPRWRAMVDTIRTFCVTRHYELAAKYERGYSIHEYYIRSDSPRRQEIRNACRPQPYIWWLDGTPILPKDETGSLTSAPVRTVAPIVHSIS